MSFDSSRNQFSEVMRIATLARHKSKECNYKISTAEAINWAITGVEPHYSKPNRTSNVISRYDYAYLKELLIEVDDMDVRSAAEASYRESVTDEHLIYNYQKVLDGPRQARVRVLTRMLWYNLYLNDDKEVFYYAKRS